MPDIYYINSDYANVVKFTKVTSNLTQDRKCRKTKTSFPKKLVENADLKKPVLNKTMTTHK